MSQRFSLGHFSPEHQRQITEQLRKPTTADLSEVLRRESKYRNKPETVDGIRFDSRLEARCYWWLKARWTVGELSWFVRQVSFTLEGGVVYRADFVAVLVAGGVEVIDATGALTQVKANKLKQLKDRYGIEVILWSDRKKRHVEPFEQ